MAFERKNIQVRIDSIQIPDLANTREFDGHIFGVLHDRAGLDSETCGRFVDYTKMWDANTQLFTYMMEWYEPVRDGEKS